MEIVIAILAVLAAGFIGYSLGYMVGHDAGWDQAANTPPRQLETAKRLMASMRKDRR